MFLHPPAGLSRGEARGLSQGPPSPLPLMAFGGTISLRRNRLEPPATPTTTCFSGRRPPWHRHRRQNRRRRLLATAISQHPACAPDAVVVTQWNNRPLPLFRRPFQARATVLRLAKRNKSCIYKGLHPLLLAAIAVAVQIYEDLRELMNDTSPHINRTAHQDDDARDAARVLHPPGRPPVPAHWDYVSRFGV